MAVRFARVTLRAPRDRLPELGRFYGHQLGLTELPPGQDGVGFEVGETELEFLPGPGEPFYHFALLVPGDRFGEALAWADARTDLLPDSGTGEVVFDFDAWGAYACYFLDPAGNIVELIAHRAIAESSRRGEFRPVELVGLSELGLVGDPLDMAQALHETLGLELWDGTVDEPNRLAFVGEQGRTLILTPGGRGWLPTGRRAEPHDVDVRLEGGRDGEVTLEGSRYRVSSAGSRSHPPPAERN
jgi:catechol 2,3-dioxygenase-like lactoylglutathione lyase family enzyme